MNVLDETLSILKTAAQKSDAVLVAYSGGKDSLAVLDLCVRSFKRVECFFMYLVPGLECIEEALDAARKRYGVSVRQYPHWILSNILREGVYCKNFLTLDDLPVWKLRDIYDLACADANIQIVASGAKRADSLWRRRNFYSTRNWTDLIYPIIGWSKFDVLGYLKARGLPLSPSSGRSATGIDLSTPSLLWLNDTYPEDFKKLCEVFPYAEAVVWRRKYHGIE